MTDQEKFVQSLQTFVQHCKVLKDLVENDEELPLDQRVNVAMATGIAQGMVAPVLEKITGEPQEGALHLHAGEQIAAPIMGISTGEIN